MIVVADTSPLNYLIQIECDGLLPLLYKRVLVPSGVMLELRSPRAPETVRTWLTRVPAWIDVGSTTSPPGLELAYLGLGEREAIQLAQERQADLLLIDERKARFEAKRRGFKTTGTLGVLLSAGELNLTDPRKAYRRLIAETSFRTSQALENQFLDQLGSVD